MKSIIMITIMTTIIMKINNLTTLAVRLMVYSLFQFSIIKSLHSTMTLTIKDAIMQCKTESFGTMMRSPMQTTLSTYYL